MQKRSQPRLMRRLSLKTSLPRVGLPSNNLDLDDQNQVPKLFVNKDNQRWELSPAYQSNIQQLTNKALIHIGICLPISQLKILYRILTGRNFDRQKQEKQLFGKKQIIFMRVQEAEYQGVGIMLWIYPAISHVNDENLLQMFWAYPQIIFTIESRYDESHHKTHLLTQLQKRLKFKQKLIFINQIIQQKLQSTIKQQLFISFKKNSIRLRNQSKLINVFLINSLLQNLSDISLHQNNWHTVIIENAIINYLSQQVEKKYDQFYEDLLVSLPISEGELNYRIQEFEEKIIDGMERNLAVFLGSDKVEEYVLEAEMRLQEIMKQILHKNREVGVERNKSILEDLFQKFNQKFEDHTYSKENINELSTEFQGFLDDYDRQQIQIQESFQVFNTFMLKNKNKLYRKIANLQTEDENQNQKKRKNQYDDEQQLKDKILLKKHMLQTLQKQVKALQAKKNQIEDNNQKIKKIWASVTPNLFFSNKQNSESQKQQGSSVRTFQLTKNENKSDKNKNQKPRMEKALQKNKGPSRDQKQIGRYACCCRSCQIF